MILRRGWNGSWVAWRADQRGGNGFGGVLRKAKIWERINSQAPVNERQRKVINRLLDGFKGELSTSKYAKLTKCSADTALRDIKILLNRGILVQEAGGGRNTSYRLAGKGKLAQNRGPGAKRKKATPQMWLYC